jgi:hypothetical protein
MRKLTAGALSLAAILATTPVTASPAFSWRRQRLPSRRPKWSRPSQQRHRLSAWSAGNHDGKDGAWVGECGA